MNIVKKSEAQEFENNKSCIVYEYDTKDQDINGSVAVLSGRYPEKGWTLNEVCKELVYVIKGSGKIVVEEKEYNLSEGDVLLIQPNEEYYWEGNMTIFMPCTPAWYPEQHKVVV